MARKEKIKPVAAANAAPEPAVSSTETVKSEVLDTSAATRPEVLPEVPPADYSALQGDGVRVRRFNPGGDAERMFQHLASCPKVPFFIPLGWGEKDGAEQWIQMNDLALYIKKNQMVEIPKPVADQLLESLKFTAEALNPMVRDGDGRWVRAQSGAKAPENSK